MATMGNRLDPHTELRDMIAEVMAGRWRERARSGVEDSPEGHCVDLAEQVMGLFVTVAEEYESVDDRRLCDADGDRNHSFRYLVAQTGRQQVTQLVVRNGGEIP